MRFRENRFVKHIDFRIIITTLALIGIGLVLLSSTPEGEKRVPRQIVYAIIGLIGFVVAIYIDYEFLTNAYVVIYGVNIAVLVLVLLIARQTKGSASWIWIGPISVQPSEFSKLVVIATLAVYMAERGMHVRDPLFFALSFFQVVALPVLLILLQRDLGTAMVCVAIWSGIMIAAGCRFDHIAVTWLLGLIAFGVLWKYGLLPAEHVARIKYWVHPNLSPQADGYQYIVTPAAIGSGGVWGAGYHNGPMTQNTRVPEQHTDMIFSVLGEEWGLIGCSVVLALYLFLAWRALSIVADAKNDLGRYVAAGVVSMLLCHVIVNIGMQIGLLPITGIPLPLLSSGGSNLITCMIGIGMLVNVHMRRKVITF